MTNEVEIEFEEEADTTIEEADVSRFREAVLYSTDWTVETVLTQLSRENIQLNPNFQRRDAWSNARKSKFIESIIIGLPIPQLVLAEMKDERGKYIVLDGKQRLLSLLKYTQSAQDPKLGFGLSGLEVRADLRRVKYHKMLSNPELVNDLNAFHNFSVRTVIIRNWPSRDFLYQVFLRLNTGSVKLSPQELRQAMAPGKFTVFVDDHAAGSEAIKAILGSKIPDPRMRDVELLVRHMAFRYHLNEYRGRMKSFLDEVCIKENQNWETKEASIRERAQHFDVAISSLLAIFDNKEVARKPNSSSFNRAIFDALSFYAADKAVREASILHADGIRNAYAQIVQNERFLEAIESDTAGIPNTHARLSLWGEFLSRELNMDFEIPSLVDGQIRFAS